MRQIDADALREKLIALNYHTRAENMNEACVRTVDYAPTVGGWISVKERLPEIGQTCLIYGEGKYCVAKHIARAEWITPGFFPAVTHWMPLPEPPEEVQG